MADSSANRGFMTYLVALVCMLVVFQYARKFELPGSYFATFMLLVTVIISGSGALVPGADALVAACVTMSFICACSWHLEKQFVAAIESGELRPAKASRTAMFCTRRSHDFALAPADTDPIVNKINSEDWFSVLELLEAFSAVERQGFYANLNYGGISELAVLDFVNKYPQNADAHVLYGHVKLCKAKRLGLLPGVLPDEKTAQAVSEAFKHFRLALRGNAGDVEAVCGLILAKGFIALRDDHLESSLQKLLAIEPTHLHGLLAAGFFLIDSPQSANRFVDIVERSAGQHAVVLAIARIIAHVQCIGFNDQPVTDSRVIADLYKQLQLYKSEREGLSDWQRGIANNIVAYAFEKIGDYEEKNQILSEFDGVISSYPWQCVEHNEMDGPVATMGSLAG